MRYECIVRQGIYQVADPVIFNEHSEVENYINEFNQKYPENFHVQVRNIH